MTKGKRPDPNRTAAAEVHIYMSASLYDSTYAAARRERMTVPEFIREKLRQATAATTAKGADQ